MTIRSRLTHYLSRLLVALDPSLESLSYQRGLVDGAAAERGKVETLAEADALQTLVWLERTGLIESAREEEREPECHERDVTHCWGCNAIAICWRLRPGVRVGVVVEEGE